MALTPAAGLVMSTRTGDIDPGLPGFLARTAGVTPEQFDAMINHESGLLGVSETSPDVRDLLACRDRDVRADDAIALFVYGVKKAIGALAAALGGLDVLRVLRRDRRALRRRSAPASAQGLEFLGIALDGRATRRASR